MHRHLFSHIYKQKNSLTILKLGKSKDQPKVGRPDRTKTVGPTKWIEPVSVQLRSGPLQAFGLGLKGEIRPSLLGKKEAAASCRENPDNTANGQLQSKVAAERENSLRRKLPGSSLIVANKYPRQTLYTTNFNLPSFPAAMKLIPSLFSSSSSKQCSPSSSDSNHYVDSDVNFMCFFVG